MPAKDHPTPPSKVSDGNLAYQIKEELGRGGFAACFTAETSASERVAVKVVKTKLPSVKVEQKFIVELKLHSKLRHKHVVDFTRAFTDGDLTYVVLELCTMGSMKDLLTKRKNLSSPEIRRLMVQICSGLSYVHSRHVIHRDLKLANILLDGDLNPKLADFGLATPIFTNEQGREIRRRTLCGTPNYIAPEVLDHSLGHDYGADIWSLGIIIFVLYTGRMPFSDPKTTKTQKEILDNVKHSQYQWPQENKARVPVAAEELVNKILSPEGERLSLDDMVKDKFFEGDIPRTLTGCDQAPPKWLSVTEPKEIRRSSKTMIMPLKDLLSESGFVSGSRDSKVSSSIFHDLLKEEKALSAPVMPLAQVYEYRRAVSESNLPSRFGTQRSLASRPRAEAQPSRIISRGEETVERIRVTPSSIATDILKSLCGQLDAYLTSSIDDFSWPTLASALPPAVIQWMDYSSKYGLGFVLSNGAIGALYDDGASPQDTCTAVYIPNSLDHYLTGQGRIRMVPEGSTIDFYERSATGNSIRVRTEDGNAYQETSRGKFEKTGDEFRDGRCKRIVIWSRFAGYTATRMSHSAHLQLQCRWAAVQPAIPLSYQRLGNTNVWIWASGATQWEFYDHVKILLSADGNLLRIWNEEEVHEMPLRTIFESLNGEVNKQVSGAMGSEEFEVRERLDFIGEVLRVWRKNGEVGSLGDSKLCYGPGSSEEKGSMGWYTIRL